MRDGTERAGWPEKPVLLWGSNGRNGNGTCQRRRRQRAMTVVRFTAQRAAGRAAHVHGKTLLRALREDLGLTGTKEGCAEGECGACTVWLDGVAVMSCLVPAERAAGCNIVTVEGLARRGGRSATGSPACIRCSRRSSRPGAVQCGYCTPGILMSAANLMEEVAHPTLDQVKEALTGNLCRCTGYYKILEAVEKAVAPGECDA